MAARKKKAKPPRRLTGKCWMAEGFPMTLHQLLPVLEARLLLAMHGKCLLALLYAHQSICLRRGTTIFFECLPHGWPGSNLNG